MCVCVCACVCVCVCVYIYQQLVVSMINNDICIFLTFQTMMSYIHMNETEMYKIPNSMY